MPVVISGTFIQTLLTDVDFDGVADPGDVLANELIITNSGDTTATDVVATMTDNGMISDPGSVLIGPIANADVFNITGNTPVIITEAQLLGNDVDPDGDEANLTITNLSAGTNGAIVDNLDGTYTFTPTTGFNGVASFTYQLVDEDGVTSVAATPGAVTINVSGLVWYVDSSSGSDVTGDGSYTNPFASVAPLSTGGSADSLDGAGNTIFLYGGSAVNGTLVLEANQQLIGDSVALNVNGFAIGETTGNSDLTAGSGVVVTLASGNTINGIDILGTGTATGLSGSSFGTLTLSNSTIDTAGQAISLTTGTIAGTGLTSTNSDGGTNNVALTGIAGTLNLGSGALSGATGNALLISGGNGSVDYNGSISHTGNAVAVQVQNMTGGTVQLDGAVSSTSLSDGISLTNNTGAAINFAGGLTINTSSSNTTGFNATGGGTITVTGAGNTITSGSGTAINVQNTTIGGGGMTLLSVSSAGGSTANAINLVNAGSGGFTITGTASNAGSGGTIGGRSGTDGQTGNGIGIYINNTNNISLSNLTLSGDFGNFGIRGVTVNNFTLRDSTTVASGDNGNFGTSNAADEGVISFDNLSGTALFEGNNLAGGHEDIVVIENTTGTLNVTFRDSVSDQAVIGLNGTTTGNDGILINTSGTSNTTVLINGVTFAGSRGDMIQANASEGATQNVTISNNTMHNLHPDIVSGGGGLTVGGGAGTGAGINITYAITGNSLRGAEGTAIVASLIGPMGTMNGTILNNTIGNNNGVHNSDQANTGASAGGDGILVRVEHDSSSGTLNHAVRIEGNNIGDIVFGSGIFLVANGDGIAGAGTARLEATILNNTIDEMGVNSLGGIYAIVGGAGGADDGLMGLNIQNNTINLTGATNSAAGIIFDDLANTAAFYFPGYAGPYDDAGLTAFHTGAEGNTITVAGTFASQVLTSPTGTFASGSGFVLPVPILAAPTVAEGWEAALREAQAEWSNGSTSAPSDDSTTAPGGGAPAAGESSSALTQAQLDALVEAAIQRWADAGATAEQLAAMRSATISIADMTGLYLASSATGTIVIDSDGAGHGWFVDSTPGDDSEFGGSGTRLTADAGGPASGTMDLLTVVMHELGHQVGLSDDYNGNSTDELMYGYANLGERRLPSADDLVGADMSHPEHESFVLAPVAVGSLPGGQAVRILWESTVDLFSNEVIGGFNNRATITFNPGSGSQDSNDVALTVDSLTIGNLVFLDLDGNGAFDSGTESGIDGVTISLFADADNDNVADGAAIATTTSAGGGLYSFAGLAVGNYIVSIDASNFAVAGALEGMDATGTATDPDNDIDNDSNGTDGTGGTVVAASITLGYDSETLDDGTGQLDINTTVDFGFAADQPATANDDAFTIDEAGAIVGGDLFADNGFGADIDPDDPVVVTEVNGQAGNVGSQFTLPSGALLTVNSDGTFDYDPNGAFDPTPTLGSGASNTPDSDSFTYTVEGGAMATVTITIDGLDSDDTLVGTAGDDRLNGGGGADTMSGLLGDDTYIVDNAGDTIVEDPAAGYDTVASVVSHTLSDNVERLILFGSASVDGTGNAGVNNLFGNSGSNILDGGAGADTMNGRGGDDTYIIDDAGDLVGEGVGGGNDTVLSSVTHKLTANFENLTLTGASAINGRGNSQANVIIGNSAANYINGNAGADTMSGGLGDDTYVVDQAGDTVSEGAAAGYDTVVSQVSYTLTDNVERLILTGSAANGTGNGGSNNLFGNSAANVLDGGAGADTMNGRGGNDTYIVDDAGDVIGEGVGGGIDTVHSSVTYKLFANVENLTLTGASAIHATGNGSNNVLTGNSANNRLNGEGGNDTLAGGGGNDNLRGGDGSDTFVFDSALGAGNVDTIRDFATGTDTIFLDDAIFSAIGTGPLDAAAFRAGTAAQDADDRIIYDSATGNLWYDADGAGGADAVLFAKLNPADPLSSGDFIVG